MGQIEPLRGETCTQELEGTSPLCADINSLQDKPSAAGSGVVGAAAPACQALRCPR